MESRRDAAAIKSKNGFTLVEIIVVLVILAVMAAIIVPSYAGYIDKARATRCKMQRADLAEKFLAMYYDDDRLRECTTRDEITAVTGENVAQYMRDNGYYEGSVKCPVDNQAYGFRFTYTNNRPKGEFICSCVEDSDEFSAFEAISKSAAAAYTGWDRADVIRSVYEEYGGLPAVSSDVLKGTAFDGETLYWRPYYLADRKSVIFFADEITYSSSVQGQWKGRILRIDGSIYVNTSGNPGIAWFSTFHDTSELLGSTKFRNNFALK